MDTHKLAMLRKVSFPGADLPYTLNKLMFNYLIAGKLDDALSYADTIFETVESAIRHKIREELFLELILIE